MQISDSQDRRNGKKEWNLVFHDLFELGQFAIYEVDLSLEKIIAKCRRLKECHHKLTAISIRNNPCRYCPAGAVGMDNMVQSSCGGIRPDPKLGLAHGYFHVPPFTFRWPDGLDIDNGSQRPVRRIG